MNFFSINSTPGSRVDVNALSDASPNNAAHSSPFLQHAQGAENNAAALFRGKPNETLLAVKLARTFANAGLTNIFAQAPLSGRAEDIKTLLGIIGPAVLDGNNHEHIASFDAICNNLIKAGGNQDKEEKQAAAIHTLVNHYAESGIKRLADQFIAECEGAWAELHKDYPEIMPAQEIFKRELEAIKTVLESKIERLRKEDTIETLAQVTRHIINSCASISKTINFYKPDAASPVPVNAAQPKLAGPPGTLSPAGQQGNSAIVYNSIEGFSNKDASSVAPAHWLPASLDAVFKSGLDKTQQFELAQMLIRDTPGARADFVSHFDRVEGHSRHGEAPLAHAAAPVQGVVQTETSRSDAVGEDTVDGDTATDNVTQSTTLANAVEENASLPIAEGTALKKSSDLTPPEVTTGPNNNESGEAEESMGKENGVVGNREQTGPTSSAANDAANPSHSEGTASKKPSVTPQPPSGPHSAETSEETAGANTRKNSVREPMTAYRRVFTTVRTTHNLQQEVQKQPFDMTGDDQVAIKLLAKKAQKAWSSDIAFPASVAKNAQPEEPEFIRKLNSMRRSVPDE